MANGRVVPFHENGTKYYWFVASKEVQDSDGEKVAVNCRNLAQARERVLARRKVSK